MADFDEQAGSDVAYFVVPQRGKTTFAAREAMLDGEHSQHTRTRTYLREVENTKKLEQLSEVRGGEPEQGMACQSTVRAFGT